ncbi:dTDP-4-dehydrorhamnose reductase [Lacinutrix jangbogonensis]|uniref:dTDP-4-dehydrorhamnose reductase n=1 Tax=Lacinutrix jangbogonensis TaxID=1469557 RepID=UPI00053E13EC|nr:dTDP-4-dehydrorhamnose reductase [Lacinutrix jangbogonensis]
MKTKVLVTGANGQLAQAIKNRCSEKSNTIEFTFASKEEFDITRQNVIESFLEKINFNYCINCAAYTAVDTAEDEEKAANNINVQGVKNLAKACEKYDITLIHISTDFVFDGNSEKPYKENDVTNPLGVYGLTKLKGEEAISLVLEKYYIIRTSWLYSEYSNNFVKTMLKLASERDEISVVNDQKGTPTNANDLAEVIIKIIESNNQAYGIYHFSNLGETTWFGFAKAIFELTNTSIKINPVTSKTFVTKAKRPKYSVLDKTKINSVFNLDILDWKSSLEQIIESISSQKLK